MGLAAKKHLVHNEWLTVTEASEKYNIPVGTLNNRRARFNKTLEEAVEMGPPLTKEQVARKAAKRSHWKKGFIL